MLQNKGSSDVSEAAPSTSTGYATENLEQLCFHRVHSGAIEISPNRSNARLSKFGTCGATFSNRPVRVNEKVYLRFVDIGEIGCLDPCISIGFTINDPDQIKLTSNVLHPMNTGYWIQWIRYKHFQKDKLLYFYVNDKGEIRYGINEEELGMIKPKVNTSGPLWAAMQLFGHLREVQFVDLETLGQRQVNDGVRHPDQSLVNDGIRRLNQSQIDDGVRRPYQGQVVGGVRHSEQSQVDDGIRRLNQSQIDDGVRRPYQVQVVGGVRHPNHSQVNDGVRRLNQSQVTLNTSGTNNLSPLRFHSVHSKVIKISPDRSNAKLANVFHFCGAIFSDRPVLVNEKVRIRFVDIENEVSFNPRISIGFTSNDPATIAKSVLNYDPNPRDTGYWIEWLINQHYKRDKLLYFYVNDKGEIRYGINGEELGAIEPKVNTSGPLWAAMQLFGRLREVQFVDPETLGQRQVNDGLRHPDQSLVNDGIRRLNQSQIDDGIRRPYQGQVVGGVRHPDQSQVNDGVRLPSQSQVNDGVRLPSQSQVNDGVRFPNQSQVNDGVRLPNQSQVKNDLVNTIQSLPIEKPLPASRYQNQLVPLNFHTTKGRNIQFYNDSGIAARLEGEFNQGYIFSARPICLGQIIVVQILATEETNPESLAIGLTSCDPATLTPQELPDNAEFLVDRPEYWVVHPKAANGLKTGEELAVTLTPDGKVEVTRNNNPVKVLYVDHTINLWAFVDICGATQKVRLMTSQQNKEAPKRQKRQKRECKKREKAVLPSTSGQSLSECTICLENQVDSVIYKCGHMCMCYKCAVKQWKGEGSMFGKCPLCRGIITDVIRTYIP